MLRRIAGSLALLSFFVVSEAVRGSDSRAASVDSPEICVQVSFENNRNPGQPVQVYLLDQASTPKQVTFTDSTGRAWFHVAEPGEYQVRVSGPSVLGTVSSELRVDNVHQVAVMHVQVRQRLLMSMTPRTRPVTSATDLAAPGEARKYYHDGLVALQRNDFKKAEASFQKAVAAYPRYDAAYNNLGVAYLQQDQNDKAMQAFEHATQINDKNADADRNYARMLLQVASYQRAAELLRKSLLVDPLNAGALALLSSAQIESGNYEDALRNARRVHELPHEGSALSHYVAGRALEHKQQWREAAAEYDLYLQESPGGPEAPQVSSALARIQPSLRARVQ